MATLWVFGAGASFGSGPCTPNPPPLGAGLFLALEPRGGVWAELDAVTRDLFVQDFEKGLEHLWKANNILVSPLLRDLAAYFLRFAPLKGNHLLDLVRAMKRSRRTHILSTTNYDLLLEEAIVQNGQLVTYTPPPVPPGNLLLLKIHGSCHFLPAVAPNMITGIGIDMSNAPGAGILDAPVSVATSRAEVERFLRGGDTIAPAIALYMRGKQVPYCGRFVAELQLRWKQTVASARRIVIVGLAFNELDDHIWEPLHRSHSPITYIGLAPGPVQAWSTGRRAAVSTIDSPLADAMPTLLALIRGGG